MMVGGGEGDGLGGRRRGGGSISPSGKKLEFD